MMSDPEFDREHDNVTSFYHEFEGVIISLYSDKKVYKMGDKIHIIGKILNVSDKPFETSRYSTTAPTDDEPVVSALIIEINQELNYGYTKKFSDEYRDSQNLIIEPGESYYREAVIDTSKLPNGSGKYKIEMIRVHESISVGTHLYIEIEDDV